MAYRHQPLAQPDKKLKVMLLTAGFGDGHHQVAAALSQRFTERGVAVTEVDCFRSTNEQLARSNQWWYEWFTRYFPWVYGASYYSTAALSTDSWLWKLLSISTRRGFLRAIKREKPDIVLQLFPDYASHAILKMRDRPWLGIVVTDFSVHSHWFHKAVDMYFIPNEALQQPMSRFISSRAKVVPSGIPVRGQFRVTAPRVTGNTRPYILIATGGRGLFADLERILKGVLGSAPNHDVYVLCGRNEQMLKMVHDVAGTDNRLHGLPYLQDVAPWFQHADFAVIKSGGVTVTECLAVCCPMVLYRPIPGQEGDNARFLKEMGAGLVIQKPEELERFLSRGDDLQMTLQSMRDACRRLARPDAADEVVDYVLSQALEQHRLTGN